MRFDNIKPVPFEDQEVLLRAYVGMSTPIRHVTFAPGSKKMVLGSAAWDWCLCSHPRAAHDAHGCTDPGCECRRFRSH